MGGCLCCRRVEPENCVQTADVMFALLAVAPVVGELSQRAVFRQLMFFCAFLTAAYVVGELSQRAVFRQLKLCVLSGLLPMLLEI